MFDVRNSVASRLLGMFRQDANRSVRLRRVSRQGSQKTDDSKTSSPLESAAPNVMKAVMQVSGIVAAIASVFAAPELLKALDFGDDEEKKDDEKKEETKEAKPEQLPQKVSQGGGDFGGGGATSSYAPEPTPTPTTAPVSAPSPTTSSGPKIKTAKADANTQSILRTAATQGGVDYALLYSITGAESSFRSGVSASTSSAVGILQFTGPTWTSLCRAYKLPYTSEDRKDPAKSAHVATLYLKQINASLTKVLGRNPTYGETYMGYFLGPSGAAKFLSAAKQNPDAIGADLFPKAASANPGVFYDKGDTSKPLTLRQILAKQEGKITAYAQDANPQYAQQDTGNAPVRPVQVALNTSQANDQSSGGGGGSSIKAGTPQTPPKKVVSVQTVRQVSDAQAENPPPPKETSQQSTVASAGGSSTVPIVEGKREQTPTLIRGRDNRIYAVNT